MTDEPDPEECRIPQDVGRIEHDEQNDIWYECSYDPRRDVYIWAIVPSVD